ncbi:MAG: hypothetical protein ACTSXQ_03560 [Alphaproteobacteria bacterium]
MFRNIGIVILAVAFFLGAKDGFAIGEFEPDLPFDAVTTGAFLTPIGSTDASDLWIDPYPPKEFTVAKSSRVEIYPVCPVGRGAILTEAVNEGDQIKQVIKKIKKVNKAIQGRIEDSKLADSDFAALVESSKWATNIISAVDKVREFRKRKWVTIGLSTLGSLLTGNVVADLGSCIPDFGAWSDRFNYRTNIEAPKFGGTTKIMCSEAGKVDLIQSYFYTPTNIQTDYTEPGKSGSFGTDTKGSSGNGTNSLDMKFWQNDQGLNDLFEGFPQVASLGDDWQIGNIVLAEMIKKDDEEESTGGNDFGVKIKVTLREMRARKTLREAIYSLARAMRDIEFITSTSGLTQKAINKTKADAESWLENLQAKSLADGALLNAIKESTTLMLSFAEASTSKEMEKTSLFANENNEPVDRETFFAELFESDPTFFIDQPQLLAEIPEVFIKHPTFLDGHPVAKDRLARLLEKHPALQGRFAQAWLDFPYLHNLYAEIVPIEEKRGRYKNIAKRRATERTGG